VFLPGIVSTEPGVMISIVFTWDCIYRDTIPGKNTLNGTTQRAQNVYR
jgi:hypothetical protein